MGCTRASRARRRTRTGLLRRLNLLFALRNLLHVLLYMYSTSAQGGRRHAFFVHCITGVRFIMDITTVFH